MKMMTLRKKAMALVAHYGGVRRTAEQIGCSPQSWNAYLAGMPTRPGTQMLMERGIERLFSEVGQ